MVNKWLNNFLIIMTTCLILIGIIVPTAWANPAIIEAPIFTDVTPAAFSVVWTVDEPAICTAEIFQDAQGLNRVTCTVEAKNTTQAQDLGVMKVLIYNLPPSIKTFFVRTKTISKSNDQMTVYPVGQLLEVTLENNYNPLIVNDKILQYLLCEDGTPMEGAILVAEVDGGSYPVTGWANSYGRAVIYMSNFYGASTRQSLQLNGGEQLTLTWLTGKYGTEQRIQLVPSNTGWGDYITADTREVLIPCIEDPYIDSISSTTVKSGDLLTISGKNFGPSQGSSKVFFGTIAGTTYPGWSDTQIQVYVPSMYSNTCNTTPVKVEVSTAESNTKQLTIDNAMPTLSIHAPADGITICKDQQNITISGTATDQCTSVSKVEIRVDTGIWQSITGTTSWSYNWNISAVSDGAHTISIRATDQFNHTSTIVSHTVNITTDPIFCDTNSNSIVYVDKTATGSGNGNSWGDAFTSIQEGINKAASQSIKEIWVAEGTYYENIVLAEGVFLFAGFSGNETGLDQRNPESHITTIDGGLQGTTVTGADNALIDGFSITNGYSDWGGSIYCPDNVDFSIYHNHIHHNYASESGGGVYIGISSKTRVIGNTIQHNEALYGGGIFADITQSCQITENTITDNTAIYKDIDQSEGGFGGGINLHNASVELSYNMISHNIADEQGGGIYIWSGNASIIYNEISHNEASWAGGILDDSSSLIQKNHIHHNLATQSGGGIYIEDEATSNVIGNRIEYNEALWGGGIYVDQLSAPFIESNKMIGNIAKIEGDTGGNGGAINLNSVNSAQIYRNLIEGNKAGWGGAIFVWGGNNIEISNNIVAKNAVVNNGGAIYFDAGASCLLVNNTFFRNTTDGNGACFAIWDENTTVDIMNCIIEPAVMQSPILLDTATPFFSIAYTDTYGWDEPGQGNINQDPRLIDPNSGNYRLRADSPCIDAGHPDPQYNDVDGSYNDMGAYGGVDPICLESFSAAIRATGQEIGNAVRVSQVIIGIDKEAETKSPAPPSPEYTVRIRLVDPDSSSAYYGKDIRACGTTEEIWAIRVDINDEVANPGLSGYYPELSWNPYDLSTIGTFSLWTGASGVPTSRLIADMSLIDHYQIKVEDGEYFYIQYTNMTTAVMDLPAGWSIISLPVLPGNRSVSALFPEAEVVYGFDHNRGYYIAEELNQGDGYWILFNQSQSYNLEGQPIIDYNREVQNGWYMIGGCSTGAQASVDHGRIEVVYGFDGKYGYVQVQPDDLKPTEGYWICLRDMANYGNLTVHSTGASSVKRMKLSTDSWALSILATGQEAGNAVQISSIVLGTAQRVERKSVAPPPPSYTVRMRIEDFAENNYYRKDIRQTGANEQVWGIRVDINNEVADPGQSGFYPILSWDAQAIDPGDMKLVLGTTESGQVLIEDMSHVDFYETKAEDSNSYTLYYTVIFSPGNNIDDKENEDKKNEYKENTSFQTGTTWYQWLTGWNYLNSYEPQDPLFLSSSYNSSQNSFLQISYALPIGYQYLANSWSIDVYPYYLSYSSLPLFGIGGFGYTPFNYGEEWASNFAILGFERPSYFSGAGFGYPLTGFSFDNF